MAHGDRRAAFADMHYDIHHAIADGTLVAVNSTLNGRHVTAWTVYLDDGAIDTVFPPTHKTFALTQSHWFRIEDGQITGPSGAPSALTFPRSLARH